MSTQTTEWQPITFFDTTDSDQHQEPASEQEEYISPGYPEQEVLILEGSTALLEITNACLADCPWCYKSHSNDVKNSVTRHKGHVELNDLKRRIEWIDSFSSATEICLLGGEPLLHPHLQELFDFLLERGIQPQIITAAVVGDSEIGKKNTDILFDYWLRGLVNVELSYQPQKNQAEFTALYTRMREALPGRNDVIRGEIRKIEDVIRSDDSQLSEEEKKALTAKNSALLAQLPNGVGKYQKYFLQSVATFPRHIITNPELWAKEFTQLMRVAVNVDMTSTAETMSYEGKDWIMVDSIEEFRQLFLRVINSEPNPDGSAISFDDYFPNDGSLPNSSLRIWSEQQIYPRFIKDDTSPSGKHHVANMVVQRPGSAKYAQVCSYMKVKPKGTKALSITSLLVRTDGECTFTEPECIAAKEGFTNVDLHQTPEEIYAVTLEHARLLRFLNYEIKRKRAEAIGVGAEGYCKFDPLIKSGEIKVGNLPCHGCGIEGSVGNLCQMCSAIRRVMVPQ